MASRGRSGGSNSVIGDAFLSHFERQQPSTPSIVVVGGGISGIAAAHVLCDASFKVILLESWDRLSGRVHTDYTFGCPVDVGASWLRGVCNENSLAPLILGLGLSLYRTSGDNSVLYDHDLESYALFDIDGCQVPQQLVNEVEETFKRILKETEKVRDEHATDMSVHQAISIVLDRHPDLRQVGLAYEVLQWYICRMEAWFAADAKYDIIEKPGPGTCSFGWPRTDGSRVSPSYKSTLQGYRYTFEPQIQYLVSHWGTDPDFLGPYSCDLVGKPIDVYEKFQAPVGNLYFAGEAASIDHSGSVHGAYSAGIIAAKECRKHLLEKNNNLDLFQLLAREEVTEAIAVPLQISRM